MTGEERAVTLVRQAWGNRPLSADEHNALSNVQELARGFSPTLSLLCKEMEMSSVQVPFLHHHSDETKPSHSMCFEGTAYSNRAKKKQMSVRCHLSPSEEARAGLQTRKPSQPPRFKKQSYTLPDPPITEDVVSSIQSSLAFLHFKNAHQNSRYMSQEGAFPLTTKESTKLGEEMLEELKMSWLVHRRFDLMSAAISKIDYSTLIKIQRHVQSCHEEVQKFLLKSLNTVPNQDDHWHSSAHHMLRIAGLVPVANEADLARIALDATVINDFNPMLSKESSEVFFSLVVIWLKLCVYDDKLTRLVLLVGLGAMEEVLSELNTVTRWDAKVHPYWLVFEVENSIQIRQEQVKVVQHLINNPGHVIQLNMGLGKTRIITPMLVMYYSFHKDKAGNYLRDKATRLNFLSALYEEAYSYLCNQLCASILGIRIYALPFCRDFKLDVSSISTMIMAIESCCSEGGVLVVAPEHRLSLELKAKELHVCGEHELATLVEKELVHRNIYRDIIDECDEVLRHRYQLIYAIGANVALPSEPNRWRAAQALFVALSSDGELRSIMQQHPDACKVTIKPNGEWPDIQFFEGDALDIMLGEQSERRSHRLLEHGLLAKMSDAILKDPPHEMQWVLKHPLLDAIKQAICEKYYSPGALEELPEHHFLDVLALRGFIAGGVLRHTVFSSVIA